MRVRPLNAVELQDKGGTEVVHVLDKNVSVMKVSFRSWKEWFLSNFCVEAKQNGSREVTRKQQNLHKLIMIT